MEIGLIDVDSKIPNLALMKLSSYYNNAKWYNQLKEGYDKVYVSKVFDFTPNFQYPIRSEKVYKGGTGYDLTTELPDEIENQRPDYDLYPDMDYAMGFTTRGCIRNCPFCVVPQKEGDIRPVNDIYDFWDGQNKIKLLDNNLTAHDEWYDRVLNQLIEEQVKVDFNQGLDVRLITPHKAELLAQVQLWKQLHFAFDWPQIEDQVRKGIKILEQSGIKPYKLMFYVLIGFNTTPKEDLHRVRMLDSLGVDPFVMPYDKSDPYQRNFARWVNHKAVFNSCSWDEYRSEQLKEWQRTHNGR